MEKKILFLCGYYNSEYNANSVCQKNIVYALRNRGYSVFVLSYNDKKKGIDTEREKYIDLDFFRTMIDYLSEHHSCVSRIMLFIVRNIRRVFVTPFFPRVPSIAFNHYLDEAEKIVEKNGIKNKNKIRTGQELVY